MTDDEWDSRPTPGLRRGRVQTSNGRDLESELQRRLRLRSYPHGVPVQSDEPHTNPISLLEVDLEPSDHQYVERLRRETDDPYALVVKVGKALKAVIHREESNNSERETQLGQAIVKQEQEIQEIKRKMTWAQRLAGAALSLAVPALVGIAVKIWERAGDERETAVLIRVLQEEVKRLRDEPRHEPAGQRWLTPPLPTQKDPT